MSASDQIAGLVRDCLQQQQRGFSETGERSLLAREHACSLILVDRVIMLLHQGYAVDLVQEIAAVAFLQERMLRRAPDNRRFWDTVYAVQARHAPPLAEEEYP
jgi:hypothetical protein